jgi:putative membrane protein
MYGSGYMSGWMWIWGIVLLGLVVAAVIGLTSIGRAGASREPTESPDQILKRRYARGEIDRETYERMLEDLRKG